MTTTTRRRIFLVGITSVAALSFVSNILLGFSVDRSQCRAAAQAIHNSRTMWEYLVDQNPGPEADTFLAEMNRRIPPAHCVGGRLVIDTPPPIDIPTTVAR